jgi:predicted RNase H-like nuclease
VASSIYAVLRENASGNAVEACSILINNNTLNAVGSTDHLNRPPGVAKDDLLDAAAAARTALRLHRGESSCVCTPERDAKGLDRTILTSANTIG